MPKNPCTERIMLIGGTSSEVSPAAEVVFNNVDLHTEILLRLPARSLLCFRSVSKHWLSLISHPQFPACHTLQNPNPSITGSYFYCNEQLNSVSFHGHRSLPSLSFLDGLGEQYTTTVTIKDSCNGLLLCSYYNRYEVNPFGAVPWWGFVVANPTTKKFTRIPDPEIYYSSHSSLIFDPAESPHYKIVTFYQTSICNRPNPIDVYSSQSGCWKRIFAPAQSIRHGVFWNGAIHWITDLLDLLRIKIDGEVMEVVSIPSRYKFCKYLGECGGSLILINAPLFKNLEIQIFEVLEMDEDDCSWIVKCVVDFRPLLAKFPEIEKEIRYENYNVLFVARGENEKDFSLVLSIPQRIVRYNPKRKVWDVLCNFEPGASMESTGFIYAFPFVETFFPV